MLLTLFAAVLGQLTGEPELREVRGWHFYAFDPASEQRYPTARVPYRPDRICWEWVVFAAPEARTLDVRETVVLPLAPTTWGDAPAQGTIVDREGRRAITRFEDSLEDGQISRRWCVAEGDPLGVYRVRVQWGDRELADIEFEMVPDEQ